MPTSDIELAVTEQLSELLKTTEDRVASNADNLKAMSSMMKQLEQERMALQSSSSANAATSSKSDRQNKEQKEHKENTDKDYTNKRRNDKDNNGKDRSSSSTGQAIQNIVRNLFGSYFDIKTPVTPEKQTTTRISFESLAYVKDQDKDKDGEIDIEYVGLRSKKPSQLVTKLATSMANDGDDAAPSDALWFGDKCGEFDIARDDSDNGDLLAEPPGDGMGCRKDGGGKECRLG